MLYNFQIQNHYMYLHYIENNYLLIRNILCERLLMYLLHNLFELMNLHLLYIYQHLHLYNIYFALLLLLHLYIHLDNLYNFQLLNHYMYLHYIEHNYLLILNILCERLLMYQLHN